MYIKIIINQERASSFIKTSSSDETNNICETLRQQNAAPIHTSNININAENKNTIFWRI